MNSFEIRISLSIALIFATRLFGLFVILPVFTPYAEQLPDANATLIGLALGIYGFTQATLQIPFGYLSDSFGRKPIITIGLILFMGGSLIAAWSTSILGIIVGRALQGAGAIGSTLIALASDLIRPQERSKAMAIIGIGISLALFLGLGLSPLLNHALGVPGLFWLTAHLAALGLLILWKIPTPICSLAERDTSYTFLQKVQQILSNVNLVYLIAGTLILHATLTALFLVLPNKLIQLDFAAANHWQLYVTSLLLGLLTALPLITQIEKKDRAKTILLSITSLLALSQIGLIYASNLIAVFFSLWGYFTAFNLLEATLPSLVSRIAPAYSRGTTLGLFSSSQFLGMFVGGLASGWLYQYYGMISVFTFGTSLSIIWLILATTLKLVLFSHDNLEESQ